MHSNHPDHSSQQILVQASCSPHGNFPKTKPLEAIRIFWVLLVSLLLLVFVGCRSCYYPPQFIEGEEVNTELHPELGFEFTDVMASDGGSGLADVAASDGGSGLADVMASDGGSGLADVAASDGGSGLADKQPVDDHQYPNCDTKDLASTVLLISLDGFRWDYLNKVNTTHLSHLAKHGVKAHSLLSVFPSKTFPNHYSIVTGLYAENHGIVSNSFYDPEFREVFSASNSQAVSEGKWWGGEPLWVTAAKQGQRSATMFWVGSEAEIQGHRPTYWHQYNGRMTHRQRIDQIIEWLCLPAAKRPTFLTLYFSDTDSVGHAHGPDSREIINTILNLDYTMGILIDELKQLGIFNKINIIVLSDHGMTEISQDRRIILSDYISLDDVYINDLSTLVALNPKADKLDLVYNQLKDKHPKLKVYKKADVPPRLRYSKHRRISEIIGIADEGWLVVANHDHNIDYAATHGYDPAIASMQGIFIGYGPAFRSGLTSPSFENIHIYNLIAHILNLKPAPNDGDFNIVKHLLR